MLVHSDSPDADVGVKLTGFEQTAKRAYFCKVSKGQGLPSGKENATSVTLRAQTFGSASQHVCYR
jgi:hypothetical protein